MYLKGGGGEAAVTLLHHKTEEGQWLTAGGEDSQADWGLVGGAGQSSFRGVLHPRQNSQQPESL